MISRKTRRKSTSKYTRNFAGVEGATLATWLAGERSASPHLTAGMSVVTARRCWVFVALWCEIFQDSLGGNCNTLLLACIWGESQHLEETMSTLRLASRMMRVQNETHAVSAPEIHAQNLEHPAMARQKWAAYKMMPRV